MLNLEPFRLRRSHWTRERLIKPVTMGGEIGLVAPLFLLGLMILPPCRTLPRLLYHRSVNVIMLILGSKSPFLLNQLSDRERSDIWFLFIRVYYIPGFYSTGAALFVCSVVRTKEVSRTSNGERIWTQAINAQDFQTENNPAPNRISLYHIRYREPLPPEKKVAPPLFCTTYQSKARTHLRE